MEQVIHDIILDFEVKPRLKNGRGNVILASSSIYEACQYYMLFQATSFKGRTGLVTSYNPKAKDITMEDTGGNTETEKQFIYKTYMDLIKLEAVDACTGSTKTEIYEENVKSLFNDYPAKMKLLIVVDKLLTGFDVPSCTYLYIDKHMQDHSLFQAICRTNRLDGEDKEFGYIVDYKDLFRKVEKVIAVYTSELADESEDAKQQILMKERLSLGHERLQNALEALSFLCEPVKPPKSELEYIHYFCGNSEIANDLAEREPLRVAFYKAVVALIRAYANIADELEAIGYNEADIQVLKQKIEHYLKLREILRRTSNETLDLKSYEADMRYLIDTYIVAEQSRRISDFDDNTSLVKLIVKLGVTDAVAQLPEGLKNNKDAVAEVIENNIRSIIVKEHLNDPAYYDKMSALLDEIIVDRKTKAIQYEKYLAKIAKFARQVDAGQADDTPEVINTPGRRVLYNNLNHNAQMVIKIDETIKRVRSDEWRGHKPRENEIKQALSPLLNDDYAEVERIFLIIKEQKSGEY